MDWKSFGPLSNTTKTPRSSKSMTNSVNTCDNSKLSKISASNQQKQWLMQSRKSRARKVFVLHKFVFEQH